MSSFIEHKDNIEELKDMGFDVSGFLDENGKIDIHCWTIDDLVYLVGELIDSINSKPTIADYLEANKEMIDKTGCKVVTIASLKKFGG